MFEFFGDCLAQHGDTVQTGVNVVPILNGSDCGFQHWSGKRGIAHPLGQVHAPDGVALHRHGANFRLDDVRSGFAQAQISFRGGRHESMSTTTGLRRTNHHFQSRAKARE